MRDLLILLPIIGLALAALRKPWLGVIGWTWISIMNPHRLSWNLDNLPLAALMAGCTLVGLLLTRDRRQPFISGSVITLLVFMIWMCITYPFSIFPDRSLEMLDRVMKIDVMILVALMLIISRKHIQWLTWTVVVSIGYFGIKGGLFTILTGGSFRVWGPSGTFIEGNNEIALAIIITIPLMRYLQMQLPPDRKWFRRGFTVAMLLMAAAALGSHSRGALLAIAAMAFFLWLRSPNKLGGGIAMVVAGALLVIFMPDEWTDRMNTISTYQQDMSAQGRINAWWMAWNLAKDRFFGGGYQIYTLIVFQQYAPNPTDVHAAHSIYFQVLGEHGFVGLFIFLLMWGLTWRDGAWLRRHAAAVPEARWAADMGAMCQVALVGYLVGGAFLSLSYFDLPYNLLVLTAASRNWVTRRAWEQEARDAAVDSKHSKASLKVTT
ncbi:putative O-glycosylation ligase, exosortase A system-associated [Niveibacterium sp. 24ML]|uniref:putative O-glycosylation ligase, exosortase A system-associated n=1 Tax=Niveibacterium sp. 24ML TaxID=2985512 RepID=UPI00226FAA2A|nr:putative O-glycosylation ligase, exosortase A system-associated [Niveibacterium sp. 24ML]MCX9156872.1 putative O-glycosylation ligase, exosortase A system-associated [Niveibacterium sp. 24ML]